MIDSPNRSSELHPHHLHRKPRRRPLLRGARPLALTLALVGTAALVACSGDTFSAVPPGTSAGAAGASAAGASAGEGGSAAGSAGVASAGAGGEQPAGAAGSAGVAGVGGGGAGAGAAGAAGDGGAAGSEKAGAAGSGQAGTAGAAGLAGAGGDTSVGGAAGSSGTAGTAGSSAGGTTAGGAAGSSGAGAGGDGGAGGSPATTLCAQQSLTAETAPTSFSPSQFSVGKTVGTNARIAVGTCGVIAASFLQTSDEMGETKVELLGASTTPPPITLIGQAAAVQSFAMFGNRVFAATTADTMWTFLTPPATTPYGFNPGSTAGPLETAVYRGLFVSDSVIAWTGRQGYTLEYILVSQCLNPTVPAGCPISVAATAKLGNGDPEPGYGVTAHDNQIRWMTPSGIWSVQINQTQGALTRTGPLGPGTLVSVKDGLLYSQADRLYALEFAAADGGAAEREVGALGGEIRDIVVVDHLVYVLVAADSSTLPLVHEVAFLPGTPPSGKAIRVFVVSVASSLDPRSLAVGKEGVYYSAQSGTVSKIPKLEIAPNTP